MQNYISSKTVITVWKEEMSIVSALMAKWLHHVGGRSGSNGGFPKLESLSATLWGTIGTSYSVWRLLCDIGREKGWKGGWSG